MAGALVGPGGGLVGPGGGTLGPDTDTLVLNHRLFGIGGMGEVLNSRPFAIVNNPVTFTNARPLRIMASEDEVYVPPPGVTTTLASLASAGASSMVVTSATGIVAGQFLKVGTEVVQVGPSYVSGTTIPLGAPLVAAHAAGQPVVEVTDALPMFVVFDKAGVQLGVLDEIYISDAPSRIIGGQGNVGLYAPRNATNLALIRTDRLVLMGDPNGPAWAGSLESQEWGESKEQLNFPDVFSLWDYQAEFDMPIGDNTLASTVYQIVLNEFNNQKRHEGEIEWASDFSGEKVFHGDLRMEGTYMDVLEMVAERSATEFAWSATVRSGRLVLKLVVRDRFEVLGSTPLHDGAGGNIFGSPRYRRDAATVRNGVKLTGETTDIASLVPEWASWAVHEWTPEVVMVGDLNSPDDRRRVGEDVSVDWSLSKAEQQRLADETMTWVWEMYRSFIYAVHDQWGRPWHEGWAYVGMPDNLIPELTYNKWMTMAQLAEVGGQPASVVMRSGPASQYNRAKRLVVTYSRVTDIQEVRILYDSVINLGKIQRATLVNGKTYATYRNEAGNRAYASGSFVGDGSQVMVSVQVTAQLKPTVTWAFGGHDAQTGKQQFLVDTRVRTSPYVKSGNTAVIRAKGTTINCFQSTAKGSRVNGSTVWHGNQFGTRWWPKSSVKVLAPLAATYITIRRIDEPGSPQLNKWILSSGLTLTTAPATQTQFIQKLYSFEKALIASWDPRRDGIGLWSVKDSIFYGEVNSKARYNFVSYLAGEATTDLQHGIDSAVTTLLVSSAYSFPNGTPFDIKVGDPNEGSTAEDMTVTDMSGPLWTVARGQFGTSAVIHETGESVVLKDPPIWDGYQEGLSYTWNEGQQWAEDMLAKLSKPEELLDMQIDGTITDIAFGSVHAVTLGTEGPWPTGITLTARCLGWARDPLTGVNGVVLEVVPDA